MEGFYFYYIESIIEIKFKGVVYKWEIVRTELIHY